MPTCPPALDNNVWEPLEKIGKELWDMVDDRIWLCTLVLGSLLVISDVGSAQQKRIYIANDDHTDYVWSASEDQYRVAFLQMLDYYLDQADQTDSLPSDFQSRFNADGNLWLWTYQHNRTADQFSRLISRIRDGHITIPLQTLVLCYGAMPAEAVIRSMYYAGRIERQYALQFELANAMENATLPYGLPSLWAGSGARYSWMGVCGCASNVMDLGHRKFELYHAVGPDGRSVLMKWHSLSGSNQSSGGYAEARNPSAAVDFASTDSVFLSRYPYDQVIGLFGKGWDDVSTLTTAFPIAAQSSSNAERRVIVSNELDFFKDLEQSAPPELIPSWAGGFGNEWDTYSATMAEVTANVKRAVESLRTAEALATVVSVLNPGFLSGREAMTDSAFESLGLYYEHDWTAGGVASAARPAFERRLSAQISRYVSALENDAAVKMGTMIANPSAGVRFCVFNPLSWSRTDIADLPYQGSGPLKVIDVGSGGEVRSQLVVKNGVNVVRILASNVPSVGYRVYEIQQGPSAFTDSCASISNGGSTFANDKYAITVNGHGALASIIDKRDGNRDLVHSIGGLAVNDIGSGSGTPAVESIGPVSASIVVTAGGTPTHRTRITVYSSVDRIDMEDEITANFGDAVTTYAFGFNLSGFTVRHEEVGGIAIANLVSYGGNYSDRNARYSYLTMNHFVDLSETGRGVTISNWDSPFFKLGSSSDNTLDVATPQIRALVGGRIDANLGIANQGGDSYFLNRYALQRHGAFDQAAAMRMALAHQNPLYAMPVTGGPDGVLPQDT